MLCVACVAPSAALGADQTVTATSSDVFTPAEVTINPGDTVTWLNAGGFHNVHFEDGMFDVPSSAVEPSDWPAVVARTFSSPGPFRYFCEAHGGPGGAGMSGIVRVNPVTPVPAPGPPPPGSPPPGTPPPGSPAPGTPTPPLPALAVTLRVSDLTPARGRRVRFFGSVRPARDGRIVLMQRRAGNGHYRTVARARLRDAGQAKSKYGVRVRVVRNGLYRARVLGDADHGPGTSRTRRLVVR